MNLASARGTPSKRQAPVEYSNIRIHPVFVNGTSALYSQLEAPDSPFFDAVKTLSSVLMVQPVQGNLIILPICTEYTGGDNEGKCTAPLPSQSNFKCGEFGIIPTEYIGTREVCPSASTPSNCFEQGPNGPGIPNTDYLLFVSAINTCKLCILSKYKIHMLLKLEPMYCWAQSVKGLFVFPGLEHWTGIASGVKFFLFTLFIAIDVDKVYNRGLKECQANICTHFTTL